MIEDGLSAFASGFQYCEISRFGHITQPINVAGNLGFLILFFFSWYMIGLRFLTITALLIFIGSSIWHATLHPLGLAFDIMPILLWVILFIWEISKNILLKSQRYFIILMFLLSSLVITKLTSHIFPMRSGIFIAGSSLLLLASYYTYYINRHYAFLLVNASFLLNLAIIARLADLPFCDTIPIGTHWLWHLMASFALIPLVRLLHLVEYNHTNK
jgi:hypothetical protein